MHVMKAHIGSGVKLQSFLTTALDGDECSNYTFWPSYPQENTKCCVRHIFVGQQGVCC